MIWNTPPLTIGHCAERAASTAGRAQARPSAPPCHTKALHQQSASAHAAIAVTVTICLQFVMP